MEIKIENLRKTFGEKVANKRAQSNSHELSGDSGLDGVKTAVDIDNYIIRSGEMLGLVGNNGAGKSTLFRLMLDLIKADTGRVLMGDTDVSLTEDWKDWTGAFIDESFLIDYLTPDEYFHFIARVTHMSDEQLTEQLVKFEHFMAGEICGQTKLVRNLSAGNKQKVGIIAAMLLQPQVLILDEPFNFLDPSSQHAIKHLLQDYNRQTGATILVSSHNLNHTVDICPRIALLEHGRIIRDIDNTDGSAQRELENYFEIQE